MNPKRFSLCALLVAISLLLPASLHARFLNTATGRFQTMDSFQGDQQNPQTLNKYVYAAGNPVNLADPTGKWASKSVAPIHQKAIDQAGATCLLPASDRQILKDMQEEVDGPQNQDAAHAYMHAMRDGSAKQTAPAAQQMANDRVRTLITSARDAEKSGDHDKAIKELGRALHTLQDSTSPAHHGFQPWYNYWGDVANPNEWAHAANESIYPGSGSWLVQATDDAYEYFYDYKTHGVSSEPLPADFFNKYGADSVGDQIKGQTRRVTTPLMESWEFIQMDLSW